MSSIAIAESTDAKRWPKETGNLADHDYEAYLRRVRERFAKESASSALFTTDVDPDALWDAYLTSFPLETRQEHNCNACRHFIQRFGGLVTIDEDGFTSPPIWDVADAPPEYVTGVGRIIRMVVSKAKVTGVFLSGQAELGHATTGVWRHLSVQVPVFKHALLSAHQAMAEKKQDFQNVMRALEEFTPELLDKALSLLNSEALYRSEKVIGPAQWLRQIHADSARTHHRANIVWRAIADAPAGFCHPRSSMIGTLLEDLASGMEFETVKRRFADKMHPLQYQRPQATPSAGNIAQAEEIVKKLGIERSLERRFARLDEVVALWKPTATEATSGGGVFGHLKPKSATPAELNATASAPMTWAKFQRVLLPNAKRIELQAPSHGGYSALVTSAHNDAPPILQWDSPERRNPVSWYVYTNGSLATQWGLTTAWVPVTAITLQPSRWYADHDHHGESVLFILEGCRDSRYKTAGNALFPEMLKSELRQIRSTVEAYSKNATLVGYEEASACGLRFQKNGRESVRLRVTDAAGVVTAVTIDRWE